MWNCNTRESRLTFDMQYRQFPLIRPSRLWINLWGEEEEPGNMKKLFQATHLHVATALSTYFRLRSLKSTLRVSSSYNCLEATEGKYFWLMSMHTHLLI